MHIVTVAQLKEVIEGEWNAPDDLQISGVSEISEAKSMDLVYAVDEKRLEMVKSSSCSLAIIPMDSGDIELPHVKVKNPYYSFALALRLMDDYKMSASGVQPGAIIHPESKLEGKVTVYPGAFVDEAVRVGEGSVLFPGVVLMKGSEIGRGCILHPNVIVREYCILGDSVILQPGCVIGSDGYGFVHEAGVHHKIPQLGQVILEDGVEMGANSTVDRGTFGPTRIGKGTKIDNLVQIAHNVEMGQGCLLASQSGISGSTKVGDYVRFGGQSGSVGHIEIGSGSTIYARGVPTATIPPNSYIGGFPGRAHKEELRQLAAQRKIPQLLKDVRKILKHLGLK